MEEQEKKNKVEEIEMFVRKNLTGDALTRLGIVRSAHPELATHVVVMLYQMINNHQVNTPVDDQTLRYLLTEFQKHKQEFNIIRK